MSKSGLLLLVVGLALFIPSKLDAADKIKVVLLEVIDGDTLRVKYNKREVKLRLIGIDAPETHENEKAFKEAKRTGRDVRAITALGDSAERFLASVIRKGAEVELEFDRDRRDKYDRLLAYVYLPNGEMLNEKIIASGYAKLLTIPPNTRYLERFRRGYDQARAKRVGLWR